jgi:hypothetical protein
MCGKWKNHLFGMIVWKGDYPLKAKSLPAIFPCCKQQRGIIASVSRANGCRLTYSRSFGPVEVQKLNDRGMIFR